MEAGSTEKEWTIPTGMLARLNKAIAEDLENAAHKAPETLLPVADLDSPATSHSSFYDKVESANSLLIDGSEKSGGSGGASAPLSCLTRRRRRRRWGTESRVLDKSSELSWEKQTSVVEGSKTTPSEVTASTADAVCKVGDRAAGSWTRYPPIEKLHKAYGRSSLTAVSGKK